MAAQEDNPSALKQTVPCLAPEKPPPHSNLEAADFLSDDYGNSFQ